MKRFGVAMLLGIGLASSGQATNAMSETIADGVQQQAVKETAATLSYFFELPADNLAFTGGQKLSFARFPEGIPVMNDPKISNGLAVLVKLRDEHGEVIGFASELEVFPDQGQAGFGSQNVVWDTVWTLMIPGRGSLYLEQQEHSGDLARTTIAHARESGQDWVGEQSMTTTVGPNFDGTGAVRGGSGEFKEARGHFVEIVNMHRVTPDGEMTMTGELRLSIGHK